MSQADDLAASAAATAALTDALAGPAEVSGDAGSVRQQPLKDLIDADRYFSGKAAARNPARGLRFTKLIPPGAV
jgi:hypothetical protein